MVRNTLRSKFVERVRPLPNSVFQGQAVDEVGGLRELFGDLERGKAAGPGGMRPEFLVVLGQVLGEEDMERLERHATRCLNGLYPAWFHRCLGAVTTVPLYKDVLQNDTAIRPLGISPSFVRCIERASARQNRHVFQAFLEPQQQALSAAGAHKLVHMVRMCLEEHEDWVCIKLDIANAHSSISRAAILEVLEGEPELKHLAWSFASSLAAPTILEHGGEVWGEAGDGLLQGRPSSGGYYCAGWQPEVRKLDEEVGAAGGMARLFSDDCYIVGPPEAVFRSYLRFEEAILIRCNLRIQRQKTMVYCRQDLPDCTPDGLSRAGVEVEGAFEPGFVCVGVAIGSRAFVSSWLDSKVSEIEQEVVKTCSLLAGDLQAKWTLLISSTQQKFGYWLSLQYPSDVEDSAARLDSILWNMFENATGLHIPRGQEGAGVECVLNIPVDTQRDQSFQSLMARLPIKERGMGLRSMVSSIPAAFLGSCEMALPFFTGEGGQCQLLQGVLGDIRESGEGQRWAQLLQSGSRTGTEFRLCWEKLQLEGRECSAFLGERLDSHLAVPVEGLGEGRTDGSTRQLVTSQLEKLRAKVLSRALTLHPDQTARPVWGWPQFDKFSCAWLLATPSPDTFLSSKLFREAMASHLFLPSPACQSHLGQPTGYVDRQGNPTIVDPHGDVVMSTSLCHDTWRTRHNDVQRALVAKAYEARVEVEAEVIGLFRQQIPEQAFNQGGELESCRQRNGCIPDLLLGFPVPLDPRPGDYRPRPGRRPGHRVEPEPAPPAPRRQAPTGEMSRSLAELKCISAGPTRYPRGLPSSRDKAANRRARALPAEYRRKLSHIDSVYNGTGAGKLGLVWLGLKPLGISWSWWWGHSER